MKSLVETQRSRSLSSRYFCHTQTAPRSQRTVTDAQARSNLPRCLVFKSNLHKRTACHRLQATDSASGSTQVEADKYREVEELKGVRLILDNGLPIPQYWVKWKDGSTDTWEFPENLADDLIRTYEEAWWAAAKKADVEALQKFLAGGREILSQVVDENRRSALHFAAGMGNAAATKLLIDAGASLDLQDKEGYTPLHMAAGYMQTASMVQLLEAGANPELKDSTGRNINTLVENLKEQIPLAPQTVPRRLALEEVSNRLIESVYEEVDPAGILDVRDLPDNGGRQFLVSFADGRADEWLPETMLAPDTVRDWEAGLEYGEAAELVAMEQKGTSRKFLVRWKDGYPDTWEPEEHVSPDLVRLFEEQHPELVKRRKSKSKGKGKKAKSSGAEGNGHSAAATTGNGNGLAPNKQQVVQRELTGSKA